MTQEEFRAPITAALPADAVRTWFVLLGRFCAAVDYDAAAAIFAPGVVSFGTRADIVSGLDNLRRNQWEGIWGNIADFRVDLDSVHAGGEGDSAWGAAVWTSTGFDVRHQPFDRPGRATVTLARRDGVWQATHTHFSLNPGTPPRTYGRVQGTAPGTQ